MRLGFRAARACNRERGKTSQIFSWDASGRAASVAVRRLTDLAGVLSRGPNLMTDVKRAEGPKLARLAKAFPRPVPRQANIGVRQREVLEFRRRRPSCEFSCIPDALDAHLLSGHRRLDFAFCTGGALLDQPTVPQKLEADRGPSHPTRLRCPYSPRPTLPLSLVKSSSAKSRRDASEWLAHG